MSHPGTGRGGKPGANRIREGKLIGDEDAIAGSSTEDADIEDFPDNAVPGRHGHGRAVR